MLMDFVENCSNALQGHNMDDIDDDMDDSEVMAYNDVSEESDSEEEEQD
jgi:hypothetical protein